MPAPELVLETTAYTIEQLTRSEMPQLALAGRSNVGKSSLVNALAKRRKLARVSATPGKTRSVNHYRVEPWGFHLVDLPGYGYARASMAERAKWERLLERYLRDCRGLRSLVLLLDSRLEPQKADLMLVAYARSLNLRMLPVFTKADKCRQSELATRLNQWEEILGRRPVVTSSATRFGILTLWRALLAEMGIHDEITVTDAKEARPRASKPGAAQEPAGDTARGEEKAPDGAKAPSPAGDGRA